MILEKKESCGLFGIFGDPEAVQKTFFGLHSLQHRGQESAGIDANLKMATRYVQDVSKQTDRVIENSRKYII